jgi:hypothetical protein
MDQLCGSTAASLIRATNLSKAVLGVAESGVPDSFRAQIPAKITDAHTKDVLVSIDVFCAVVYATRMYEENSLYLPRIDTGNPDQDAAGRDLHEKCCRTVHLTMGQMLRTVVSVCEEYAGPMHKANHAQGAATNMIRSLVLSLNALRSAFAEATDAVCDKAGLHKVIGTMPLVTLEPQQTTAFQAICGPDTLPSSSLQNIVDSVRRALIHKSGMQ